MASSLGPANLAKYQELSKKVSKVSVSRSAGLLHFGQVVSFQSGKLFKLSPRVLIFSIFGSSTGRSDSGTITIPQSSQWITGIGHPQYLCLEIPQSLSLKFVSTLPLAFAFKILLISSKAFSKSNPSNFSLFIRTPFSSNAEREISISLDSSAIT